MGSRSRVRVGVPIEWIEGSSAEEIAQGLLSVDPAKAAAVVVLVARRSGEEAIQLLDDARAGFDEDPVGMLGSMLVSGLSTARKRKR